MNLILLMLFLLGCGSADRQATTEKIPEDFDFYQQLAINEIKMAEIKSLQQEINRVRASTDSFFLLNRQRGVELRQVEKRYEELKSQLPDSILKKWEK